MKLFKNFLNKIRNIKKESLVRNSFLVPILLVVIISISHVITWYDLGNPLAWAMYLSIAIEVFALASISAASINISKGSIWFLFGIVTSIQMIGNVFFSFNDIDVNSELFKSWIELVQPLFSDWDMLDHRRFLALIQGGSLPIMSLTALHFYIKFNERRKVDDVVEVEVPTVVPEIVVEPIAEPVVEQEIVVEPVVEPEVKEPNMEMYEDWRQSIEDPLKKPDSGEDMAKFNPQE